MSGPWTFKDEVFRPTESIDGFDVRAIDGTVGRVERHSSDDDAGFMVVDTTSWTFGKKRLIPAGVIDHIDYDEQRVFLRMSMAQIRCAPDLDDGELARVDHHRETVQEYYEPYVR